MPRIDDGFKTTVTFGTTPTVKFWEKKVTPPGVEGGGAIDTTTMRNTAWRTKAPKVLQDMSDMKLTVAYDPTVISDIVSMRGVIQQIIVTFPDSVTLTFWGWLESFTPNELAEGEQPTAEVTITPSNQNTSGEEVAPVTA